MTTESKAGEALDLNKSRAEFEAWARSKGSANFMRMSGDPEAYDDLILRAQFKAWCAALARRSLPVDGDLLNAEELAALRRFDECAQDGEGYDVPKEMMQRLAEIGVVRRKSGSYYEHTAFGLAVLATRCRAEGGDGAPEAVSADRAQQGEPHDDDIAWEHFASATKAKMAEGREKGRGGWEDPEQCPTERLQLMLLEHLKKGDPVDVANFCMMLWTRGEPVVAVDLKAARQAVLEDAAAICDNFAKRDMHPAECAGAIRMMKDSIK